MTVKIRQLIERRIAQEVILRALQAGYAITVNDGEEDTLIKSQNEIAILKSMFTTDEDILFFSKRKKNYGWVKFVYGNDGYDVVSDYTTNLDPIMKKVKKVEDAIEDGRFQIVIN